MSAILPQNLLNISSTEIQYTSSTNHADIVFERAQVLHMFWKVHFIRYKVSRLPTDKRSQNLFWRTWSNAKLAKSVSTSTLTALWDTCRGNLDLSTFDLIVKSQASQSTASEKDIGPPPAPLVEQSSNPEVNRRSSQNLTRDDSAVTRTELSVGKSQYQDRQPNRNVIPLVTDGVQELTTSCRQKSSRPGNARSMTSRPSNSGRERGNMKGRPRPSLVRRRSTQSGKTIKSPRLDPTESNVEEQVYEKLHSHGTRSAISVPLASSWEDDLSAEGGRISPTLGASGTAELAIDKDFRGRFAERIASTSNLASLNKFKKTGSVVRFADEVPAELWKSKGPLSTTFEAEIRPTLPHRESIVSVAISDGDADEDSLFMPGLQRTESSLSLLLRRAHLEDGSLPVETRLTEDASRKTTKQNDTKADEIDALLAMGRRGGVTKAGGIQLPPQQQLREDIDSTFSSPSPDRIF